MVRPTSFLMPSIIWSSFDICVRRRGLELDCVDPKERKINKNNTEGVIRLDVELDEVGVTI